MAEKKQSLNVEELKAQIEAEVRAKIEAEAEAKVKGAEKAKALAEEELQKLEKNLEAQVKKDEKDTLQKLKAMKKVSIEIPEDPNNPDDVVPVGWQGVIYSIPRGQQFEVPEVIYQIWKESHEKTKEINKRIRDSIKREIKIN
ncbi:hypothetical protein [Metabacillus sp. cB07]|uniref:hypothetical protein n=1 Tax=Metabacillus sp. cB07 TaxID=2806989 RepID=UPI00193A6285|nr:hypothetical protein [Metabacillus sp. cB07]